MTRKQFADLVRFYTNTDPVQFPDETMLLLANIYMLDISELIVEANEDYFLTPATTDLIAGQREYRFPADMLLKIKRLEAKFSPTDPTWITLDEFDLIDFDMPTDETTITNQFSNNVGQAFFDIVRGAIWLYSGAIANVTDGLKLWFSAEPKQLPDLSNTEVDMSTAPSTTEHGFPKPFHEILARRVSIHWKSHADVPIPLTEQEQKYSIDLAEKIRLIKNPNLDRAIIRSTPDYATPRFGNNGYDL